MAKFQKKDGDIVSLTNEGVEKIKQHGNNYDQASKPIAPEERDWSAWNLSSLWIGIIVSIATYQIASGLIVSGMAWYQALFTIVLGHTLVMIPAIMLGHFGTKFGMSFPMLAKMMFGIKGSIIPALVRAIVGIFWFGIQTWIGGQAVNIIIGLVIPPWKSLGFAGMFISFLIFWALNVFITQSGAKGVKILETYSAPALITLSVIVVVWALSVADWSFNTLFTQPAVSGGRGNFMLLFFPALSAMIAFDGGPALSMADFTRHTKSQKSQVLGQIIIAPIMAAYIAFVGICGTSASSIAFGEAIWEPAILVSKFENPLIVLIFSLFIIAAVLTTNVAGNLVPPSIAFSTLFPKKFSYNKAVIFSAGLGLLTMPWYTMSNPESFINVFLGGLGTLLGPITGLFIASYWFELKQRASIVDLYRDDGGQYYYEKGWNKEMTIVFAIFTVLIVAGAVFPPLKFMFDNSYVLGGGLTGITYYIIVRTKRKLNESATDID